MPLFDASKELAAFYDKHVRLGKDLRDQLAGYRDTNLARLNDGLDKLSEARKTKYAHHAAYRNQGSYAMHTLNQCEHDDYDIDVAVIFEKDDLPADAAAARQLVCDALREATKNLSFLKEPEARGNAVTIWYADGYHIDFAVYRRVTGILGHDYEHAGADGWARRNPEDVTQWFDGQVDARSPRAGLLCGVEAKQLRRVVRFVKRFAKSRAGWSLPGGMIVSALVCEVYRPSGTRDDIALYDTLVALRDRLATNKSVTSPVAPFGDLIDTEERRDQVQRLYDYLAQALKKLEVLTAASCTREQAMKAWGAVFWHEFWDSAAKTESRIAAAGASVAIECELAKYDGGRPLGRRYSGNGLPLPKGLGLRFMARGISVPPPYQVRWTAVNEGDEAAKAKQLTWTKTLSPEEPCWTSTAYRGRHKMRCEVLKDGVPRAMKEMTILISGKR